MSRSAGLPALRVDVVFCKGGGYGGRREEKGCARVGDVRPGPGSSPPGKGCPQTSLLPRLYRLAPASDLPLGEMPCSFPFPAWYRLCLLMWGFVFLAQAVAVATTRAEHFVSQEQTRV